ncbi:hypothetical protein [Enterococcus sp. AZ109]|uniref:hypothetical protein n=1 Tax=Enterococcus sp. AZ109 TaxID=2774634 RepID=UPI003F1F0396
MNNENEFIGWGDSFVAEESQFTLLPAGEYPFTIVGSERKIYDGNSTKIQNGTPFVELEVKLSGTEGETTVKERLYMVKKFSWKLTQFFTSIGQAPVVGQPFSPNWNVVIGSKGRAKVEVNSYTKDGQQRQNNRVTEFLKPAANSQLNQGQPQPQNNQQTNTAGGFQPGAF